MDPIITYHQGNISVSLNDLSIVSINIHSLRNKLDILEAEVTRLGAVGVVVVTETWIQPGTENFFNLRGFVAFHEVRTDGYGGLTVFVNEKLPHSLLRQETNHGIHSIVVKLQSTRIVATYRQPSNNVNLFLQLLDDLLETNDDCILVGDINIDILSPCSNLALYQDTLETNSMFILNKKDASFNTFPLAQSIIDHFCVNFVHKTFELYRMDVNMSDHVMQMLVLKNAPDIEGNDTFTRTNWNRVTYLVKEHLRSSNSTSLTSFHSFLINCISENTSTMPASTNSSDTATWFDASIRSEMNFRDFLNRRRKDPSLNPQDRNTADTCYKRQRNKVTSLIRISKRNDITTRVQSAVGKQSEMWQIINMILTNRKTKPRPHLPHELYTRDDSVTSDTVEICNELIDYFSSIAEVLKNELLTHNGNRPIIDTLHHLHASSISMTPITEAEVSKVYLHVS